MAQTTNVQQVKTKQKTKMKFNIKTKQKKTTNDNVWRRDRRNKETRKILCTDLDVKSK